MLENNWYITTCYVNFNGPETWYVNFLDTYTSAARNIPWYANFSDAYMQYNLSGTQRARILQKELEIKWTSYSKELWEQKQNGVKTVDLMIFE